MALPPARRTLIDRVIGAIDPAREFRRIRARQAVDAISASSGQRPSGWGGGGFGGYQGARRDRAGLSGWAVSGGSANADLLFDLPLLRERSRDLERNSPLAGGAINTVVTSVVGGGPMLKARLDREALGLSDAEAEAWEGDAERLWLEWSESSDADVTRVQPFNDLCSTVCRAALVSGDVVALKRFVERPGRPWGLCYQLIEADRLSNPGFGRDTVTMAGGVEMDADGAPLRYHVLDRHPGNIDTVGRKWIPVEAFAAGRRQVYHLFLRLRPEQARGVPYLAPVVEALKQLSRYSDAEIMAAVVNACFAVVSKTAAPQGMAPLDQMTTAVANPATGQPKGEVKLDQAGLVVDLDPNEEIAAFTPGRPSAAFDPFVMAILRQIGVALELPFEVLVKHFTASYSAARAALLEAAKFFKVRRQWLARSWCQPVYEDVLTEAVARGRLRAPGFLAASGLRQAWCGAHWVWPSAGQIDPTKEVEAAIMRVNGSFSTLDQETAELTGGDWDDVHQQQVKELRRRTADGLLGVALSGAATTSPKAAPGKEPVLPPEQQEQTDKKEVA